MPLTSCFLRLISCLLLLASCAKKMLPPSPDRFAPHLEQIQPINRMRLDLIFDEYINTITNIQNLYITSSESETLRILNLSVKKNIVTLFSQPTKPGIYQISGSISDKFNNFARINKKFQASLNVDTIAPKISTIYPSPGAVNKTKNIYLEFSFNEPVDTSSQIKYYTTSLDTSKIRLMWQNDWQKLTFGYSDSLLPKTTVYFLLLPTIKDLENNQIKDYGYTFFTSDSNLSPVLLTGELFYKDQPYKNGIIIFSESDKKAFTLSDVQGIFSIRLDSLKYNITALADTNYDNFVDLISELNNFNTTDTNQIKLELKPISEKKTIDEYLY